MKLTYRFFSRACAVLFVLGIVACNKEKGDNHNLNPNDQVPNDYMSTKPGSWWLFGAADGQVFKRMATGRDSIKKGLLFSYYETLDTNTGNITPEYFGKNLDRYLGLFDLDGKQTDYIIAVLLRDSVEVGEKWSNTEEYQSVYDVKVESEVMETGGQLVLNGKTFTSVTRVHNVVKGKHLIMTDFIECGWIDVWFARGVGLIKEDVDINLAGLFKLRHTDSLLDYHIAP